jgi:hypothetical protein
MLPNKVADPGEYREALDAKLEEAHRQFREREITLAVYQATLFGLGLRGRDLWTYANLNWPPSKLSRVGPGKTPTTW